MLKHIAKYTPDFELYEQLKRKWVAENPNSTPEQYQQAMARIAQQCRI
jgi:hypothetical protein